MKDKEKLSAATAPEDLLDLAAFVLRLAANSDQDDAALLRVIGAVLYDAADALSRSARVPEVAEQAADDLLRAAHLALRATRVDRSMRDRQSAVRTAQNFVSLANYRVLIAKRASGTERR